MTLAEFYATHRSPQAIIVPRRAIRLGGLRRQTGVRAPTITIAAPASSADKKH
jgi:hypothetical protein